MAERHSEYTRHAHDFYVEPAACVDVLLARYAEDLSLGIHDPCCGSGTIPTQAIRRGFPATGADLVDRAGGQYPVRDFMFDREEYRNIVTNPPFSIAPRIVLHALDLVVPLGIVAVICQAKFLFSQGRFSLFQRAETERVLIFSRRPSMPTGEFLAEHGEAGRKGGSIDFCWVVWRVGKVVPGAQIEWVMF